MEIDARGCYLGWWQAMAVTVRQFEISSRVYSRFKPHMRPLLQFWKMDPSLPGVMQKYGGDSSAVRDQLKGVQQIQATHGGAFAAILEDGSVVTWGDATLWRWQFGSSRSAQGCAADSSHIWGLCCDSGRWIRRYLGWCRLWRWQFGSSRSAQGCAADSSHMGPLLRFWKMDPSLPGVMHALAVTVRQFEISSRVCSRFKPHMGPLLRFWKMDPSWPGVMQAAGGDSSAVRDQLKGVQQIQVTWGLCCDSGRWIRRDLGHANALAVTVRQFEISSRVCSRFKPHLGPLLRFWKMDPSWPGVMQTMAVTVRQFEISSRVCSRFKPPTWGLCCDSGRWIRRYLGSCRAMAVTVRQFEISSRVCSRFKPHMGPLLRFWKMDPSLPGAAALAVTVQQFEMSWSPRDLFWVESFGSGSCNKNRNVDLTRLLFHAFGPIASWMFQYSACFEDPNHLLKDSPCAKSQLLLKKSQGAKKSIPYHALPTYNPGRAVSSTWGTPKDWLFPVSNKTPNNYSVEITRAHRLPFSSY